jgi:hypothetical protein
MQAVAAPGIEMPRAAGALRQRSRQIPDRGRPTSSAGNAATSSIPANLARYRSWCIVCNALCRVMASQSGWPGKSE